MQIKTNNLTHIFDKGGVTEHVALDKVNITIGSDEYIAVIGQTGSGKTTFIEHLNALIIPSDGTVEITDVKLIQKRSRKLKKISKKLETLTKEIASVEKDNSLNENTKNKEIERLNSKKDKCREEEAIIKRTKVAKKLTKDFEIGKSKKKLKNIKSVRKQVGIVFQFAEYQLFEETIEKDIIFGPLTMGVSKEEAKKLAKKYIKIVGMDESYLSRSPFSLSGGQKRRVALAGILAMEPKIMIFDEPTAGLDPQGEIETYKIFDELHRQGKTIIIVTHNLDHALEYTKRTIMFKDGKVVADGKSTDVLYNKKHLEENYLSVPKLVDLVLKLEAKGKTIGKVKSIKELVSKL